MAYIKIVASALAVILLALPVILQSNVKMLSDINYQKKHIKELEQMYKSEEYQPVDEASFYDGDLQADLDNGIKYNEMSFISTHNSYQTESVWSMRAMYNMLANIVPDKLAKGTGTLDNENLTNQLNCGIRGFEIDVETVDKDGDVSFRCMHSPIIDMTTSCYDFELTLKEISMWSDNNPNHLPITILIEPKAKFAPMPGMKFFNNDYAKELDACLRENLGNKLFTPADMLRDYASFKEMRDNDDWCKVSDMLGKVVVLLHYDVFTDDYVNIDPTIKTQAMFPALVTSYADKDYAGIIMINDPFIAVNVKDRMLKDYKFIVRTRADAHPEYSQERLDAAMEANSQIMSTDYPPKTTSTPDDYVVTFNNHKTIKATFAE